MTNIIGKYTARELQQIDFYNKIKNLDKMNLSQTAIKERNIKKLGEYKFIDPIYKIKLDTKDTKQFNLLVNELNDKIKEVDKSLPKLEKITDTIHQFMKNPQFITINPRTYNAENELFNELHNILRFYFRKKFGARWYKKIDTIPNFFLFEENGKVRDVEKHTHYHLLIDIENDEAKDLKDFIFLNLLNLHQNHYKTIKCNDLKNVEGMLYAINYPDEEVCKFPPLNLAERKEHIDENTGEVSYFITYLNPKYQKLEIDLTPVEDDGIYSYTTKESTIDEKRQLLGLDFYNETSKIYNKQDVLFANSN